MSQMELPTRKREVVLDVGECGGGGGTQGPGPLWQVVEQFLFCPVLS